MAAKSHLDLPCLQALGCYSSKAVGELMPKGLEKRQPAPSKRQAFDIFIQSDALQIRGRLFHKGSDVALAGLQVEALCRPGTRRKREEAIGSAVSGPDGQFQIN